MNNLLNKFTSFGIDKDDSTLRIKSKQLLKIDLIFAIILPILSEIILFIKGTQQLTLTVTNFTTSIIFLLLFVFVYKKHHHIVVYFIIFFSTLVVLFLSIHLNVILLSSLLIVISINALLYFPERKNFSITTFSLLSFVALISLIIEFIRFDSNTISEFQLNALINGVIIWGVTTFYKIISLVYIYQSSISLLNSYNDRIINIVNHTNDAIHNVEFSQPIPLNSKNIFEEAINRGFIKDCNQAFANIINIKNSDKLINLKVNELKNLIPQDLIQLWFKELISNNFFLKDKTLKVNTQNNEIKYFKNNCVPNIKNGNLIGYWASQSDITQEKIAQNELHKSEKKYKSFFNNVKIGISSSYKGQFSYLNNALCNILGYPKEELLKMKLSDFSDDKENIESFIHHSNNSDQPIGLEDKITQKNGNQKNILIQSISVFDDFDNYIETISTVVDISHLKEIENNLIEQEQLHRALFDGLPVGVLILDIFEGKRAITCNKKIVELFETEEDVILSKDMLYFSPEYQPDGQSSVKLLKEVINNYRTTRDSSRVEWQFESERGRLFEAEISFTPIIVNDQNRTMMMIHDISARKSAERESIESKNRYQTLFENAFDGILIYDVIKEQLLDCNEKMANYFEVSKKEIIERYPFSFLPKEQINGKCSKEFLAKLIHDTLENGKSQNKIQYLRKNQTKFTTEVYSVLQPSPNNHLIVSIMRDVSEKEKQEEVLIQTMMKLNNKNKELEKYIDSNMKLENFAYIASHDLKGPIRTIGSFSQILQKKLSNKLNENEMNMLNFINKGAKNMQRLVNDLLTYSKADQTYQKHSHIPFYKLLKSVIADLKADIDESKATIEMINIPEEIIADRTKIRQLFQNLISNAIKFKKQDTPLTIKITCENEVDYWKFSVEDNGIGIEKEFQDKIFMLFRKLHPSEQYEGTGLGLSICKKIVEFHKGEINVESEFGVFTKFIFTIKKQNIV